jgi:transcriptional regulator with XRE-family HTH domain
MIVNDERCAERGHPRLPSPIDRHVGSRVRKRRTLLGMSQEQLGTRLGLTFQQVQKYENGANRIGASRLFEISRLLNVTVEYFFDDMTSDMSDGPYSVSDGRTHGSGEQPKVSRLLMDDQLISRETQALVRAYYRIATRATRKHVLDLIQSLGAKETPVGVPEAAW